MGMLGPLFSVVHDQLLLLADVEGGCCPGTTLPGLRPPPYRLSNCRRWAGKPASSATLMMVCCHAVVGEQEVHISLLSDTRRTQLCRVYTNISLSQVRNLRGWSSWLQDPPSDLPSPSLSCRQPPYLTDLLLPYHPTRTLHSTTAAHIISRALATGPSPGFLLSSGTPFLQSSVTQSPSLSFNPSQSPTSLTKPTLKHLSPPRKEIHYRDNPLFSILSST